MIDYKEKQVAILADYLKVSFEAVRITEEVFENNLKTIPYQVNSDVNVMNHYHFDFDTQVESNDQKITNENFQKFPEKSKITEETFDNYFETDLNQLNSYAHVMKHYHVNFDVQDKPYDQNIIEENPQKIPVKSSSNTNNAVVISIRKKHDKNTVRNDEKDFEIKTQIKENTPMVKGLNAEQSKVACGSLDITPKIEVKEEITDAKGQERRSTIENMDDTWAQIKQKFSSNELKKKTNKESCDLSSYACLRKIDLKRHIDRVYSKVKPFQCEKCQQYFSQKPKLENHIKRIHLKIQPLKKYSCTKCKQSFEKKHHLEHHMNSFHLNIRPYKCKQCNRAPFFQERNLKNHVATVHSKIATI